MFAFIVSALIHELLAALIVNHPRDGMREFALAWVAGSAGTDQIRVDHPAAAKAQDGIEPRSERMHFSVGGRVHIGTAKDHATSNEPSC